MYGTWHGLLGRFGGPGRSRQAGWALAVFVVFFPPLYVPLLRGYPDALGLIVIVVLLFACVPDYYRTFHVGRASGRWRPAPGGAPFQLSGIRLGCSGAGLPFLLDLLRRRGYNRLRFTVTNTAYSPPRDS